MTVVESGHFEAKSIGENTYVTVESVSKEIMEEIDDLNTSIVSRTESFFSEESEVSKYDLEEEIRNLLGIRKRFKKMQNHLVYAVLKELNASGEEQTDFVEEHECIDGEEVEDVQTESSQSEEKITVTVAEPTEVKEVIAGSEKDGRVNNTGDGGLPEEKFKSLFHPQLKKPKEPVPLPERKFGKFSKEEARKAINLHNTGWNHQRIADEMSKTRSQIDQLVYEVRKAYKNVESD